MTRHRHGYALIELLAVMSVSSTVLVLLSVWLVMLVRGSDAGQKHLLWTLTQDRLAQQFRMDVNESLAFSDSVPDQSVLIRLDAANDRSFVYRLTERKLVREEFQDRELVRQEAYRLSQPVELSMQSKRGQEATWLVLAISRRDDRKGELTANILRIEARLGMLHRFERPTPQEETP